MNWIVQTFASSVGKKVMMAVTGLGFCLFLVGHLAGNLSIYGGRQAFNAYAANKRRPSSATFTSGSNECRCSA